MIITSLWDIREVRSERVLIAGHTADLHAPTKDLGHIRLTRQSIGARRLDMGEPMSLGLASKEQRWGIVGASCGVALGDLR